MTIASEITRIKTNIDNAYTALEAKGATIPSEKNSANLANTVATVTGGGGETNYLGRIVTAGILTWDYYNFAIIIPSHISSIWYRGLYNICAGALPGGLKSIDFNNVSSLGQISLGSAFQNCKSLLSVDFNKITSIGESACENTFDGCSGLTDVNFNKVSSIDKFGLFSTFLDCTNLTNVNVSSITSVSDNGLEGTFMGCTSLTSINFNNLSNLGSNCLLWLFHSCTSLTSLSFPALNSNSFGSYTNQFDSMLNFVTGCTVHFPSNLESVIGDWSDVIEGFGGTNTTVLFDLPATT